MHRSRDAMAAPQNLEGQQLRSSQLCSALSDKRPSPDAKTHLVSVLSLETQEAENEESLLCNSWSRNSAADPLPLTHPPTYTPTTPRHYLVTLMSLSVTPPPHNHSTIILHGGCSLHRPRFVIRLNHLRQSKEMTKKKNQRKAFLCCNLNLDSPSRHEAAVADVPVIPIVQSDRWR